MTALISDVQKVIALQDPLYGDLYPIMTRLIGEHPTPKLLTSTAESIRAYLLQTFPSEEDPAYKKAQKYIVGKLFLDHAPVLVEKYASTCAAQTVTASFERMAQSLVDEKTTYETFDLFMKNLTYVYGDCVVCGVQAIQLISKTSIRSLFSPAARSAYDNLYDWGRVAAQLGKNWYRTHTDPRMLQDFNEAGWDAFFKKAALFLENDPSIHGIVATAWFYDPQIVSISPNLAYLQQRPLERGAFVFRHGPGPHHTIWATERSPTRRKLYEEGKYLPQCYSMIWPRNHLIAWAKKEETND